MKAEFSLAAVADLEAIAHYIARDNPKAAGAWVDRLVDRADKAATLPSAGHQTGRPDGFDRALSAVTPSGEHSHGD